MIDNNPLVEVDIDLDGDISVTFADGTSGYIAMPPNPAGGEHCLLILHDPDYPRRRQETA